MPWYEILRVLQIPASSKALPILLTCPLCGQMRMRLFEHSTLGGAWYHCEHCQRSGDLLDLAGRVMHTTPEGAILNLSQSGLSFPPEILQGGELHPQVRQPREQQARIHALFRDARKRLTALPTKAIATLKIYLGMAMDINQERWKNGPCRLVGVSHSRDVERAFYPDAATREKNSHHNVLPGRRWRDVVVVPFYDRPGRICGMGFAGKDCESPDSFVYRSLTPRTDPGLAFLPAVAMAGNPKYVVAVNNWVLALRMHMKHFRTHLTPLPLVAWHSEGKHRTQTGWECLGDRKVIIWTPKMDAASLLQAVKIDGLLAVVGDHVIDQSNMRMLVKSQPTTEMMERIMAAAAPWRKVLRSWTRQVDSGRVNWLIQAVDALGGDIQELFRQCGRSNPVRVPVLNCRSVQCDKTTITEQFSSWFATVPRSHRVSEVCNFVLRITHTIRDPRNDAIYHVGFVNHHGRSVPFIEKADILHEDTYGYVRWLLHVRGVGTASCRVRWRAELYDIATLFFEPSFVNDDVRKWKTRVMLSATSPL